MTVKIIACEVMKEELLSISTYCNIEYEFMPMKLHLNPEKLNRELQNRIDSSKTYSRIVLAFGLCGGALRSLKAASCTLTIPRVHDCISIFLDGSSKDENIFKKELGIFYLSGGWIISEKSILSEHKRIKEKYGERKAYRVLSRMYESYKKIMFIKTGCIKENEYIKSSKQIAKLLNLDHEITEGSSSFIEKIVNGPYENNKFININQSDVVKEEYFNANT
ncbi:MAG: DUF1638 domain-containing protein [Bacillota bacterium]|nr:DUF1638 domain-containing protein [Bacillota bacterium]